MIKNVHYFSFMILKNFLYMIKNVRFFSLHYDKKFHSRRIFADLKFLLLSFDT